MTIAEAIQRIDELKPNAYTQEQKVAWLSELDGMIKRNIIDTHEDGEGVFFVGYDKDTDLDTNLIAYPPYDGVYLVWLESRIDYANGEYAHYNNSVTRFNEAYSQFRNDYNSHHMPKGVHFKYF